MPITVSQLQEKCPPLSPEEEIKVFQDFQQQMKELIINTVKIQYPKPGMYDDVLEAMPYVSSISLINPDISEEKAAIATIQQSDPTDFQAISASKLTLNNSFYNNALRQSQQSFLWALIWGGVGAIFIIVSVILIIILRPALANSVIIALLGGTGGIGAHTIARATLQLYKQASDHAAACHIRLDRASDFILANSACEGLNEAEKQQKRSEIISKLVE
jgi:hypothetical protein